MALYKTEGVVLRLYPLGEADRIVTLLTPERGKVRAVVKGVRRPRSRMVGSTQLFTHGRFLIYEGKNLDTISQGEITHAFRGLREDLQRMACASYVAEMLDKLVEEQGGETELFALLLATFAILAETERQGVVLRAFEIQAMTLLGYRPVLDGCVVCGTVGTVGTVGNVTAGGADGTGKGWRFSPEGGGLLCVTCAPGHRDARLVSAGAIAGLRRLMERPVAEAPIFRPSAAVEAELERLMWGYVQPRLPSPLKSIVFLKSLS